METNIIEGSGFSSLMATFRPCIIVALLSLLVSSPAAAKETSFAPKGALSSGEGLCFGLESTRPDGWCQLCESKNDIVFLGSIGGPALATYPGPKPYVFASLGQVVYALDVSDWKNPAVVAQFNAEGKVWDIHYHGDLVLVAGGNSGLSILRWLPSRQFKPLGKLSTPGFARRLTAIGKTVYLTDDSNGIHAINIGNPKSPILASTTQIMGSDGKTLIAPRSVAVVGRKMVVSVWNRIDGNDDGDYDDEGEIKQGGLAVLEVAAGDPYKLEQKGLLEKLSYNDLSEQVVIDSSGDIAYVAGGGNGLVTVNISDPTAPSVLGLFASFYDPAITDDPTTTEDEATASPLNLVPLTIFRGDDHTLYVGASSSTFKGVAVVTANVDYTDPANPVWKDMSVTEAYEGTDNFMTVAVKERLIFVANDDNGFRIIDRGTARMTEYPLLASSVVYQTKIAGEYAFVVDYNTGLTVVDVSDPTAPTRAGLWFQPWYNTSESPPEPVNTRGLAIKGDKAYVVFGEAGFFILSLADPANPKLLGSIDSDATAAIVELLKEGETVVAEEDESEENPDTDDCGWEGYLGNMVVIGSYAYVTSGCGLVVIDIADPRAPSVLEVHPFPDPDEFLVRGARYENGLLYIYGTRIEVWKPVDPTAPENGAGRLCIEDDTDGDGTPDGTETCRWEIGQHMNMDVGRRYAYFSTTSGTVDIVDLGSESEPPAKVSSWGPNTSDGTAAGYMENPGVANGIAAEGDRLFVSFVTAGETQVLDIGTPESPTYLDSIANFAYDIDAQGGFAYLAMQDYGLVIAGDCSFRR